MRTFPRLTAAVIAASFALPAFAADTTTTFAVNPFTDVPTSSPYYQAIEHLREQKVLKGYEDGTFKPNARINRAEFVKLITNPYLMDTNRLNECLGNYNRQTESKIFFSDVSQQAWYAREVCHSYDRGIIKGYPDGTFRPNNDVIFVEAAKMISGVFNLQVSDEGTPWYKEYVDNFSDRKAIPTSIRSLSIPITRGEMAEMIYRLKTETTNKASKTAGQLN
jgi:S-layer homology domain